MKASLACLILAIAPASWADTLTVDRTPGSVAMFNNFADAYDAASDGDTILLAGSANSYGSHQLYKRLKIVGPGYHLTQNPVPGLSNNAASISLQLSSDVDLGSAGGSEFGGLSGSVSVNAGLTTVLFTRCGFSSIDASSQVVIRQCNAGVVMRPGAEGSLYVNSIGSFSGGGVANLAVERCVITSGFFASSSTSVSSTIFDSPAWSPGGASFSHCAMISTILQLPSGAGNLNNQTILGIFGNQSGRSPDERYRLSATSPAKGAGTGGSDMGAFGGPAPYVLSGVPGIPRLTRLVAPTTATSTSGLQFEVDAQAFAE